jgi:RNA polymerase sigma-70 factor, ECF subfamily
MAESGSPSDQPSGAPDDARLMERVARDDVEAFDEIVRRYWRTTNSYVQHLVGDPEKASDMTQETFARLWEHRSRWQPSGPLGAWLLRVARNAVISDRRKWRLHTRWKAISARDEIRGPRTPLQETEVTEIRTALERAIDVLPARRREVFVLFHLQNLSHREIAEIMGIRPQTVANHLYDAALELRGSLKRFLPHS